MQSTHVNNSIGCNVTGCKFHCKNENYCSLDHIAVAKQYDKADSKDDTFCRSFECDSCK